MPGFYLTHPEVVVRPDCPVTEWGLSQQGVMRLRSFSRASWLRNVTGIVASAERKAQETAALLSEVLSIAIKTDPDAGENDRSATGYLPPAEFEFAADAFFASPDASYQGWETARAAQRRIFAAAQRALAVGGPNGSVLMVGHGAVGTLLRQSIRGAAISRTGDQTPGGGCLFAFDLASARASAEWARMEDCHDAPPGLAPATGNSDAAVTQRVRP
jgi:broad specificity phosphatase PhoE